MPIVKPQGLRGLQGLGGLSKAQYDDFVTRNKDLIAQHGYDPVYINNLYSNKQFIDKYGIDKFRAIPDMNVRNAMYKDDIVNTEFNKRYSPFNTDGTRNSKKGLGANFEKYNQLSTDAKLKLMESNYLSPAEFENSWQKRMKESAIERSGSATTPTKGMAMGVGVSLMRSIASLTNAISKGNGLSEALGLFTPGGEESAKKIALDKNQKILDNIYNDDADTAAERFSFEVSNTYLYDPYIVGLSDSQVKETFVQAITPGSYKDKNSTPNLGISEFASHYGNGSDSQVTSEMEDFSIDDMRQILAKKKVYDANMSPDMAAAALNNEAKRYIKEHQGRLKKFGLFAKDVGISTMSYIADKLNGIAEIYRTGQDAFMEKPIVYVDDENNILDPSKVEFVHDKNGTLRYIDKNQKSHSVHRQQVDRTTLHNLGKNEDGSDIEGAASIDWMTLNPQYWTKAEEFGTLDKDEQNQYEKIGSSPYKVAYNPNEDSDLWYESYKMMSFGIADGLSQLVPFGIGAIGRAISTASKIGKVAKGFGKVLDTTGKMLTAETRTGQILQGTSGALGIAYAYNRGAFPETLQQNIENMEERVSNKIRNDIYNRYHSDKKYKAKIDQSIDGVAKVMKQDYLDKMRIEGGMKPADMNAIDKMIHAKAQDYILAKEVRNNTATFKESKDYADMQQKAIDGAGDAAFNTYWTEALKYGMVNNFGHRKFLYQNPAGVTRRMSQSLKGLKEITTSAGRKRLATEASKFLTRGDKLKQLGKTAASQVWGGAWTNGTDDMQVDAAERINEDSFNRYLDAWENGEAMAATYGLADGLYSYVKGLQNSLGQETTWNAALVGGVGSAVNVTPNFANIASLFTKQGRQFYKDNFRRSVERNSETGEPLKNADGSIKYKNYSKWHDPMGQANFFLQNGILSSYYGKKQAERDLQSHADYVNNLLDEYNDFADIEHLVAANLASDNLDNVGDEKTANFLNALYAIRTLNNLGKSSKDPATMSSVVQNAKNLISRASELNLDEGIIPFSDKEISNLLSQYYAQNKGVEQNDENNQKALYNIAQNAQKLQEAAKAFDTAEKEIAKIEKNTGIEIDRQVKTKMMLDQALGNHWKERREKMMSEIGDTSNESSSMDAGTVISTLGGKKNAEALVKVYDRQKEELQKVLDKQGKKSDALFDEMNKALEDLNVANEASNSDAALEAGNKYKEAKAKYAASKAQEDYIDSMIAATKDKQSKILDSLSQPVAEVKEDGTITPLTSPERVLTADEIFALDSVTRARMMREESRSLYNKEQQREIEKLEQRLLTKDADALQKVQDIGLLTQRINSVEDAYTRMAKNPEAAAWEIENQRKDAVKSAAMLIDQRNGEILADYINQMDESLKVHPDIDQEAKEQYVYQTLRQYNSRFLDVIDHDNLLPQYFQQVKDAKEWAGVVEDIDSIISQSDKSDEEKKNLMLNINNVLEQTSSREEIMTTLDKVVEDISNPEVVKDFEYILDKMETLGYQRDSTILEDRKQRKEREAKQKEKEEAEKKRVEEASKAAAEKQKKEAEEKQQQQGEEDNFIPTAFVDENDTEEVDFGGNNTGKEPKVEAGKEDNTEGKEGSSEAKGSEKHYPVNHTTKKGSTATGEYVAKTDADGFTHITYSGQGVAKHKVKAGDFGLSSEQLVGKKEDYVTEEAYNEVVKDSQDKGFTIDKVTVRPEGEVSIETPDGITIEGEAAKTIYDNLFGEKKGNTQVDNTNDSLEGLEKQSNITVEGDIIKVRSENIDEQMKEDIPEGKEVTASDVTSENDIEEESKMQEKNSNAKDNVLSGNAMFPYEQKPLEDDGILKMKVGAEPHDVRNTYTAWMKAAGVNLQNIIDHELALILQQNPHAKVKFMAVAPKVNATNDYHMKSHLMLVLDYDDSINNGITSTHDDANGGVFESHGKKYLVVGTVGYGNRNANKFALYQTLWNYDSSKPTGIVRQGMIPYFKENPTERFYVNDNIATEVVPYSLIQGYRVKQLTTDESPFEGSISKLLADKERNPYGYTMDTMAWGIQEASQFMIVGASLNEVRVPRNKWANLGRAFALVPASNGKMFPIYLKPLFYQEMKDGVLKEEINTLLQDVTHVEADKQKGAEVRTKAINKLCSIFFFSPEGDAIYTGKSRDVIYMYHDGEQIAEFNLDGSFDRNKFLSKLWDMNPRINITGSVLADAKTLAKYDEAGALDTDVAMLGTAGSYFDIYPVDGEGKMIVQEKPQNPAAVSASDSDYRNIKRSQVPYRNQFYTVTDTGEYYLYGKPVTDEKIIRQLDYNKQIVDRGLVPAKSEGVWKYYIMSEGEHPEVVKLNENNKEVRDVPEEQAKKIIEEYRKQREAKAKEKAVEDALKEAEKQGKLEAEVPVEMDDSGITIDPNTGEAIQEETKEAAPKEEDSRPEEGSVDQEVKQADVKHIDINATEHKATQRFSDLIKNPKYSFRILKIARDKWKDAPKDFSQLGTFLKGKGVNMDNIGTTEKDIESWMKTLEDCK